MKSNAVNDFKISNKLRVGDKVMISNNLALN